MSRFVRGKGMGAFPLRKHKTLMRGNTSQKLYTKFFV